MPRSMPVRSAANSTAHRSRRSSPFRCPHQGRGRSRRAPYRAAPLVFVAVGRQRAVMDHGSVPGLRRSGGGFRLSASIAAAPRTWRRTNHNTRGGSTSHWRSGASPAPRIGKRGSAAVYDQPQEARSAKNSMISVAMTPTSKNTARGFSRGASTQSRSCAKSAATL